LESGEIVSGDLMTSFRLYR